MSGPRRPSVSIYDYPEHLNPFNDDITNTQQSQTYHESKTPKETRHKFWTFGRSRKKRSNSFSIKSSWNGLFGKRKNESEPIEKQSTINTVSTTYKKETCNKPIVPPRLSKDQQEFDEALGTLSRRRKYTLDNTSRCNSNLTVNGDPARIYDGSPQNTTTSIMGDLTPKPPARRFGQVSPRPTDKIPSLNFEDKEPKENGNVSFSNETERTPVPPLRRLGNRSSQRLNGGTVDIDEDINRSINVNIRDENENVWEDYAFKRFNQNAVRKSNLSISSCISVNSTASTHGRKKRRAPQPPKQKDQSEISLETDGSPVTETNIIKQEVNESINIVRVTENVNEMTKKTGELNEKSFEEKKKQIELAPKNIEESHDIANNTDEMYDISMVCKFNMEAKNIEKINAQNVNEISKETEDEVRIEKEVNKINDSVEKKNPVEVKYSRSSQEKIEIIKDINQEPQEEEVELRKKILSGTLSRSNSFSVKQEIEKIEKQIKALESKNVSQEEENINEPIIDSRLSIQANRKHFFENMVDKPSDIKIEFKKLPREQKDIDTVRLTDSPIPIVVPREPIKVIELHISEPIKHKPEFLDEVNPIPKPRRHSALSLNMSENKLARDESKNVEVNDKRGKSF